MKKKCIVIETDNSVKFEKELNQYLNEGYEIKTSSCNTRLYKAVLVLNTEKENIYGIIKRMEEILPEFVGV